MFSCEMQQEESKYVPLRLRGGRGQPNCQGALQNLSLSVSVLGSHGRLRTVGPSQKQVAVSAIRRLI